MQVYRRAINYFVPDWLRILALISLIAVSVSVGLLEAWPLTILIDTVLNPRTSYGSIHRMFLAVLPSDKLGQLVGLVLIGMGLQLVGYLAWMGRTMINFHLNYRGTTRVRHDLFSKFQQLGLTFHRNHPQGDSIYRLTTDAFGPWGIMDTLIGTSVAAVSLTVMTLILLSRNVSLTLAAFAVAPFMIWSNWIFGVRILQRALASKQIDADLTSCIQQAITRVPLAPVSGGMTVGLLLLFMDYVRKLWDPLKWLTEFLARIRISEAAAARVFRILDAPELIVQKRDAIPLKRQMRTLRLEQVSFGYRLGQNVLNGFSLQINPGEMVAFVGPSGSGKTTLLALLMRFYDPTEGVLKLDDFDFREIRLADLRAHMALVTQESLMLATSIRSNIAYGKLDASLAQIESALEMAGAAGFIKALPEGVHTVLTEGGLNLSGGQRQRLAIARALLTEAPFLILDEPTSALDPEHETRLIDTLIKLRGKRTIVLVTHRLEAVVPSDQIFVLGNGLILERGTHQQLLQERSFYAQMWGAHAG